MWFRRRSHPHFGVLPDEVILDLILPYLDVEEIYRYAHVGPLFYRGYLRQLSSWATWWLMWEEALLHSTPVMLIDLISLCRHRPRFLGWHLRPSAIHGVGLMSPEDMDQAPDVTVSLQLLNMACRYSIDPVVDELLTLVGPCLRSAYENPPRVAQEIHRAIHRHPAAVQAIPIAVITQRPGLLVAVIQALLFVPDEFMGDILDLIVQLHERHVVPRMVQVQAYHVLQFNRTWSYTTRFRAMMARRLLYHGMR